MRGPVEPVHDVHELVVQQVAILVLLETKRGQALLVALIVLGDLVLVFRVDLHAELVLQLTLVSLVVLHLDVTIQLEISVRATIC